MTVSKYIIEMANSLIYGIRIARKNCFYVLLLETKMKNLLQLRLGF